MVGALCYSELATAYRHPGGDYHYLTRAYGRAPAFLFAWSRMAVLQTGSIALLAFVFGDYASELFSLGDRSSPIYAALLVGALTGINVLGLQEGKWTQKILTTAEIAGLLMVVVAGLTLAGPGAGASSADIGPERATASVGLALVFVLLTYGGWNEAAYISEEVRGSRSLARALLWGIAIITAVYLLANLAYLKGLGLSALARSEAPAADLMRRAIGEQGAAIVSALVAICAITSANATILTGARTNYAMGRDYALFRPLGRWHGRANTPVNALLIQGAIALSLVAFGARTRSGFTTMVEYTAPVFWAFFLMTGLALILLRIRDAGTPRPFRVPFYPVTPLLFCATSAYMLWSSLAYTGAGSLLGVAVLFCGVPVLLLARSGERLPLRDEEGSMFDYEEESMKSNRRIWMGGVIAGLAVAGFVALAWPSADPDRPRGAPWGSSIIQLAPEVPYVPTREDVLEEMLRLAQVTKEDVVYDLGCGDGRIVIAAAKQFGARGVGIDIDPERVEESKANAQKAGVADRVKFLQQDLFDAGLKEATVVMLYLLPNVNLQLRPKLLKELRPGTRVLSHNYDMGDWKPQKEVSVGDHRVYYWVVPLDAENLLRQRR